MVQLNDIKGYWSSKNKFDFNEDYKIEGQFILCDNGYFEGIVSETGYGIEYEDKRLIFGYYMPEKNIQLVKVGSGPLGTPQYYRGTRDAKGYSCEYGNIDSHGDSIIGNGWIITKESEKQEDISFLAVEISELRQNMNEILKGLHKDPVMTKNISEHKK